MVLPGPEAQQLATYIGWLMHRTGGVVAGTLFVLPSLLSLLPCRGFTWRMAICLSWPVSLRHKTGNYGDCCAGCAPYRFAGAA